MKRKALLIGYSGWDTRDGKLQGVSKDLNNYRKYLLSLEGGAWYDDEIITLEDTNISILQKHIEHIKQEKNDIVFTVYSGHGEYDSINHCRNICIDNKTERSEHILYKLAPKQIIILDSCSGEREDEHTANESRAQILLENKHISKRFMARKKYEEKCDNCVSQTLKFYAAERGTYANDTSEGGIYSTELLRALNNAQDDISIFSAHKMADKLIRTLTDQKPDYDVPRLLNYLPGVIHV